MSFQKQECIWNEKEALAAISSTIRAKETHLCRICNTNTVWQRDNWQFTDRIPLPDELPGNQKTGWQKSVPIITKLIFMDKHPFIPRRSQREGRVHTAKTGFKLMTFLLGITSELYTIPLMYNCRLYALPDILHFYWVVSLTTSSSE